jgi:hypothetical protein
MTNDLCKKLGGRLLIGLMMSLLTGGCTLAQERAGRQDAVLNATVSSDGKFQLRGADGKPLPRCQLCDEKLRERFGRSCEKLKDSKDVHLDPPLCAGSSNATLNSVDQILVIRTHVNPYCFIYYLNGQAIQGPCYCYPGETPPPGITCVNQ